MIVSSGFSETGAAGKALEDEIREIAAVSGMRILGPNCQGVANIECGLAASFSSVFGTIEEVSDGPTAVVSQSGAMAAVLTQLSLGRSNGVRYWAPPATKATWWSPIWWRTSSPTGRPRGADLLGEHCLGQGAC